MKLSEKIIKYSVVVFLFLFCVLSIYLTSLARGASLVGFTETISKYASMLEDQFYDFRMKNNRATDQMAKQIALAHIDDNSLAKIGRWPWSRTVWVKVLHKLDKFGAKVITSDIFFSEPEEVCNASSPDLDLAAAINKFKQNGEGREVILPYSLAAMNDPMMEEVPGDLFNWVLDSEVQGSVTGYDNNIYQSKINSTTFPVPTLLETTPGLGFLNTYANLDGVFRHFPVLANVDTLYFPSLALMSYEAFSKDKSKLSIDAYGNVTFNVKSGSFQLNKAGETKIRYFGDASQFPEMSIWNILNASDDDPKAKALFENKVVFLATTAMGAHDLRHTPLDAQMPGVFIHMNLLHMLLEGYFFKNFDDSILFSLALLVLGLTILLLVQARANAILDLVTLLALFVASYYIDVKLFLPDGYEIRLLFCYICFLGTYSWITFYQFYKTSKEKAHIRGAFARYVAPAIVNQMLENPDRLTLGGEKKDITCIFSDVRDFTSISEKLTPTQLSTALNIYMTKMTNILFDNLGTLDKYIGDAIVGYWGAPVDDPNHAYYAIKGAVAMVEALPEVNAELIPMGIPEFKFGIGLNSGECSLGNMGSDRIFSYTALGDNMNLGARLEGLTKFYGVQLMISEFTHAKLSDEQQAEFTFRKLDCVRVKGKEKPVVIYEVLHPKHHLINDPEALDVFHNAFDLYTQQEFNKAIELLNPYKEKYPEDKSFKRLIENCQEYLEVPPPPGWDGVTVYKTK